MKLHRNVIEATCTCLSQIMQQKYYPSKVLETAFKSRPQWGGRDRRFVAEAVYDIVRNFRLFAEVAGNEKNFWFITAVWMATKKIEIPDWQEFVHADASKMLRQMDRLSEDPRLLYSYPDWLWTLCNEELGTERWMQEAEAMHQLAEVFVRVNTLKTSREKLQQAFASERNSFQEVTGHPDALQLARRENIFSHRLFSEGWFEVQDAGSQEIAPFLQAQPGELVIDACAGAGGKSLHLAANMKNKGRIIAMDVEPRKLEELKRRARRAGVHIIETRTANENTVRSLSGKADRLLLDVPCSGLGVLRRNPDAKWKLDAGIIERTRELQRNILRDYQAMLKPGGTLVYSTCSVLPSENEAQVALFVKEGNFKLADQRHLWPSEGFDGFYMARLLKD